MRGSSTLYTCISSSIAPSRISRVGMWGRKSFPTKKHMNTAATSVPASKIWRHHDRRACICWQCLQQCLLKMQAHLEVRLLTVSVLNFTKESSWRGQPCISSALLHAGKHFGSAVSTRKGNVADVT